MATSSTCGKERGGKALRGAGSWRGCGSEDPVAETLEIAAKEVVGGKLIQMAANGFRNHVKARGPTCKGGHAAVCRASLLEYSSIPALHIPAEVTVFPCVLIGVFFCVCSVFRNSSLWQE